MSKERADFNPNNPFDFVCDFYRVRLAMLALEVLDLPQAKRLNATEKLSAQIAGVLTGLIGLVFAQIEEEGRDVAMDAIIAALPLAREQAESVKPLTEN